MNDNLTNLKRRIKSLNEDITNTINERKVIEEPRTLDKHEIQNILDLVPNVLSPVDDISNMSRSEIVGRISYFLKLPQNKIVPSTIPELIKQIQFKFNKSRAAAGLPAGILAAQAIGAQLMQATLNTFHKSGSKKNVSSGFKAYDQFLSVTKNWDYPSCNIFFKEDVTFEQVIKEKRSKLINTSVGNLINNYDILEYTNIIQNGSLIPEYKLFYNFSPSILRRLIGQQVTELEFINFLKDSGYFLRLNLNINNMYNSKILYNDICEAIENKIQGESVICIQYSNIHIDIFPIKNKIMNVLKGVKKDSKLPLVEDGITKLPIIFINSIIIPNLNEIKIKGIKNISALYPEKQSVWSIVDDEIRHKGSSNIWLLRLNTTRMRNTGINSKHIIKLWNEILNIFNVKSIELPKLSDTDKKQFMYIMTPPIPDNINDVLKNQNIIKWNPGQVVNYLKLLEMTGFTEYAKNKRDERNILIQEGKTDEANKISTVRPMTKFEELLDFIYAVSDGTNLIDLLANDEIDETRTISNDPREIINIYGVEAARNFFIKEGYDIILRNDNYVNPRHIILIGDHVTRLGFLSPITQKGMSAQPVGTLTQAGYMEPKKYFHTAALEGKKETLNSVYPSIMTGHKVRLGTGLPIIGINTIKEKEFYEEIKNSKIYAEDIDESITSFMEENSYQILEDVNITSEIYATVNLSGQVIQTSSLDLHQISPNLKSTSSITGYIESEKRIYGITILPVDVKMGNTEQVLSYPIIIPGSNNINYLDTLLVI